MCLCFRFLAYYRRLHFKFRNTFETIWLLRWSVINLQKITCNKYLIVVLSWNMILETDFSILKTSKWFILIITSNKRLQQSWRLFTVVCRESGSLCICRLGCLIVPLGCPGGIGWPDTCQIFWVFCWEKSMWPERYGGVTSGRCENFVKIMVNIFNFFWKENICVWQQYVVYIECHCCIFQLAIFW